MANIIGIFLGILLSTGGVFLIQSAYRSWQDYFTLGSDMRLTGTIELMVGAVAVFFIATLLFIGNEFYKNISVRLSALFFSIILIIGGIIGVIETVILFYAVLTWEPVMGAYASMFGLGACLAFSTAVILIWRVRRAGWLKRKQPGSQTEV